LLQAGEPGRARALFLAEAYGRACAAGEATPRGDLVIGAACLLSGKAGARAALGAVANDLVAADLRHHAARRIELEGAAKPR
jgi:hypothetical protein